MSARAAASIVVTAAAAAAAGCASGEAAPRRSMDLVPCFVEGVRAPALCGSLRVFEDRAAAAGRTIDLRVVVIPALAASPAPDPVFFLAGGPGQAATQIINASLSAAGRLRDARDLVFVDQRGTGGSHALFCPVPGDRAPLAETYEPELDPDYLDLCKEGLDADLRLYTTTIAMDDLDDVRAALGYEKINVWGTSYGTRAALQYLRAHGDHVRSAVLDGVAPMSLHLPLFVARDAERAFERLFSDCAAEPACARAFPELGPRFRAFVAALEEEPVRATVRHPLTGAPEDIVLTRGAFVSALRGLLYSPELSALVPLALHRAMAGDLDPFVALTTEFGSAMQGALAMGMYLSVICSEDAPLYRAEDVERVSEGTLLGPGFAREALRACDRWPRGAAPANLHDPVASDAPVLLMSGELDPVTPPTWADDAKRTLRRSAHVVFSGTAHNAATSACAQRVAAGFVERASEADLDAACAAELKRPPFFATFAGSP